MNAFVIDTNVLIECDNTDDNHLECAQHCEIALQNAKEGIVVIDSNYMILKEYEEAIRKEEHSKGFRRQLPFASAFLNWVHQNLGNIGHIEVVDCSQIDVENHPVFTEGSELEEFDPPDRKFVIVAMESTNALKILVATDTDWWNYQDALRKHVHVEFVCDKLIKEFAKGKKR